MSKLAERVQEISRDVNARPLTDYVVITIVVGALTGLGLIMVTSSSMTWSVLDGDTAWGAAGKQAAMVVVGVFAYWSALRMRPAAMKRWAGALLVLAFLLLILVLIPGIGTGRESVGSQSWIALGPLRIQPSEIAKVAIAVWGSAYLADRVKTGRGWDTPNTRFLMVALCMVFLIFLQGDVGMALAFIIVVGFVLFFAGVHPRFIVAAVGVVGMGLLLLSMRGGFRSDRFTVYFDALFGSFQDTQGKAFQSYQGFLSLADGSLTGVGLGQSRAKWFYLPEAKNDFIFAIIGEELGLWGGAMVICLFGILAWFGLRTAQRSRSRFQRLLAASLTAGVVAQAFINIGYVIGVVPVTGIQLPMISAGGTSAIITLFAMGLLANCARHEPEAISNMQNYGRSFWDRLLHLPEPMVPNARRPKPQERPRLGRPVTSRGGSVVARKPANPRIPANRRRRK
ncbi:FtsW/RodA/SpoVE family cell cycle protein [Corynebacterium sp.]|uniref:FtsW/RodA/SpoVE family cell cycle protein n=1 Tax=Corynebacterium sp. TaxID=1720 RepID=UPI0026DCAF7B|nr:putative peptidoglycan glycosyltransferase FtsW [Corynebacterium sp.]MDO5075931.1 putative peptidoglycan glycosyltransferase FtsW [Corynebacterium sp.]